MLVGVTSMTTASPAAKYEAESLLLFAKMLQVALEEDNKSAIIRYLNAIGEKLNAVTLEIQK